MEVSAIIAGIDAQIKKLTEARKVLEGIATPASKVTRGRPKGSKNATTAVPSAKPAVTKRKLTPEGRKRIADAMKRRWAERKKVTAK